MHIKLNKRKCKINNIFKTTNTMKEYIFNELGNFSEQDCTKIKEAMEGRTYMQFSVEYSNYAGNCTLIVKTDYEDTEEHIKSFFLHCLITSLINK